jgi:glycosyltransferase involved in cell wall biosynthesis
MTTLHILSSPHSPVHINNRADPFSIAVIKFINQMSLHGWNCIHYSIPNSVVSCTSIQCLDELVDTAENRIIQYNDAAAIAIGQHKQPNDMIVCFHGIENQAAAMSHPDLKAVEPSIGYMTEAVFAEYRAFVSYAQMHMFYGARGMLMNPSWWDAVIPNGITSSEFEYTEKKDDYFLYFGRVIESKGIHIAIQATAAAGKKLIIAGPGKLSDFGYSNTPAHVTIAGLCDATQRNQLMMHAKAVIGPTHYVEPFGNMVVEGYMCGTPAITTDWGGFSETVVQGVTGFRCREFKEFISAINNIDSINPLTCRSWAVDNYDDAVVHKQFNQYFNKLLDMDFYR